MNTLVVRSCLQKDKEKIGEAGDPAQSDGNEQKTKEQVTKEQGDRRAER